MKTEWWPTIEEYNPGLSKEDWLDIINNRELCSEKSLHVLARFYEYGGEGTCSEIEDYYEEQRHSYNPRMKGLADRLVAAKRCQYMNDEGDNRFFPILFLGRYTKVDEPGTFKWKLRDELREALEEYDVVSWDQKYLLRLLADTYKKLIDKTNGTGYMDDELYKWEYISNNANAGPLEIINYLITNNLNIYDRARNTQIWKALIKDNPKGLENVILKLKDENIDLHERIAGFKTDMIALLEGYSFANYANDERTAACFLSCWNPQKYTIYKAEDLYGPLCRYLGIKTVSAGFKYEHFLELAGQMSDIVQDDPYLQQFFAQKTVGYVQSGLLIAQTVIWCIFSAPGKELLYGKTRNYWSGGVYWGKVNKTQEFITNGNWQIGWDKNDTNKGAKEAWQNIKKVKTGDYLAFHSCGGRYDLKIHYLAEVVDKDTDNGILYIEKLPDDEYYSGKGPKMEKGRWLGTLLQVTGSDAINLIFHVGNNTDKEDVPVIPEKIVEYGSLLSSKKNVILQGAPGTGKTYSTASLALYIIAQKEPEAINGLDFKDHKQVMERYEKYREEKQIAFCTFHQSMDYEDFVEGLRPEIVNGGSAVAYNVKPGIFKEICTDALSATKDRADNFDEAWAKLISEFDNNDYLLIPILSGKKNMRIELNEYGNGLTERTYEGDVYKKGEWIDGRSRFFNKEQLYNVYRGLPGVPAGGHDNYRKAIVLYMKQNFGLKDYVEGKNESVDKNYVLIIDEINRGYISKIFGELITLLEKDKRLDGEHPIRVKLPYSNEEDFGVPGNLFVIGTMNTTDRTTGTLDYALRRRFDFITIEADPSVLDDSVPEAKVIFEDVKAFIEDKKLDDMDISDLMIGHSYFIAKDETELKTRIRYEVIPLVKEYIKDGILNCLPGEAKEYFDDWMELNPHSKGMQETAE